MNAPKLYTPAEVITHIEFLREHEAQVRQALRACRTTGAAPFDGLYGLTADMLEGLLNQLQQAWHTQTGVKYDPLCDLADGLGTNTDAVVHVLISIGLLAGTPRQFAPTLLGARLSTPDGMWDSRLHDVINAHLEVMATKHQAEENAADRLQKIADAESRNGGAQ